MQFIDAFTCINDLCNITRIFAKQIFTSEEPFKLYWVMGLNFWTLRTCIQ